MKGGARGFLEQQSLSSRRCNGARIERRVTLMTNTCLQTVGLSADMCKQRKVPTVSFPDTSGLDTAQFLVFDGCNDPRFRTFNVYCDVQGAWDTQLTSPEGVYFENQ